MIDAFMSMATVEWIIALGAVSGALTAIYKFAVRPIARAIKRIGDTYEHVMAFDGRLQKVEERSEELVHNSGSSLKDAVARIERGQRNNGQAITEHIDWANNEILKVWQSLAAKDTLTAARETKRIMDERGTHGMDERG